MCWSFYTGAVFFLNDAPIRTCKPAKMPVYTFHLQQTQRTMIVLKYTTCPPPRSAGEHTPPSDLLHLAQQTLPSSRQDSSGQIPPLRLAAASASRGQFAQQVLAPREGAAVRDIARR